MLDVGDDSFEMLVCLYGECEKQFDIDYDDGTVYEMIRGGLIPDILVQLHSI